MAEEMQVLAIVAGRLDSAGLPYLLSGSLALAFYGVPRMTRDIDVVVDLRSRGIERFLALASPSSSSGMQRPLREPRRTWTGRTSTHGPRASE